jgi:hypothetical protein
VSFNPHKYLNVNGKINPNLPYKVNGSARIFCLCARGLTVSAVRVALVGRVAGEFALPGLRSAGLGGGLVGVAGLLRRPGRSGGLRLLLRAPGRGILGIDARGVAGGSITLQARGGHTGGRSGRGDIHGQPPFYRILILKY